MVRVGVLGEDDELARIIGPVAQRVKVERAPEALRLPKELRRKPTHRRIARTTNPCMLVSIARGMSPGTGPYTGTW